MSAPGPASGSQQVFVFAPSPLVTITVEQGEGGAEIHLHAGGQGFWIARMLTVLGVEAVLCGVFAGETGAVARTLVEGAGIRVRAVNAGGCNGAYVHDRRSGERVVVAETPPAALSRHEVDELYGAALVEGLDATVAVLAGPGTHPVLPADVYRRLARDLRENGKVVVADLSGEPLGAALAGGIAVLKVSHEDLLADGRIHGDDLHELAAACRRLGDEGADTVVLTHGDRGALVLHERHISEVGNPRLEPVDHRGAGDALTAGLAAGLARAMELDAALRLGTAAGALNVTRRGLASGTREEIERLAERIQLRPWLEGGAAAGQLADREEEGAR